MKKYFCNFDNFKRILIESIISEGKHWPKDYKKTAINTIKNSPIGKQAWYSDDLIEQDVDTFVNEFGPLSHKNSNLGYFATIIKWFTQYAGTDPKKYQEFIERKLDGILRDLLWLSNSPSEESKVKEDLKTKWTFENFEKYQDEIEEIRNKNSIDIKTEKHEYSIIPIDTYEQMNSMFGGERTGYQGRSEWCHTNGKRTYENWVESGRFKFFVLARNDWENITPPDPKKTINAYDDYGLSLIAILVSVQTLKLKNATLRWNHIIEPGATVSGTSVDHAFNKLEEINQVVGFDIKEKIKDSLHTQRSKINEIRKNATKIFFDRFRRSKHTITDSLWKNDLYITAADYVKELIIPDNIIEISDDVFSKMPRLEKIQFGNNLKYIGKEAFSVNSKLTSLEFPDSLEVIGIDAFLACKKLTDIKFGSGLTLIDRGAFNTCISLQNLVIPGNVQTIGLFAFNSCKNIKTIIIEDGVKSIGSYAFFDCLSTEKIVLPNSITSIGSAAFAGIRHLESVLKCKSNRVYEMAMAAKKW